MIYHYTEWQQTPLPWLIKDPLSLLGIYAVCTFYTLSGFALFVVYRQRRIQASLLSEFWIKRVFRIVPLFWLVSTLAVLITKSASLSWAEHLDAWTIFLNYSLLFSWLDPTAYLATGAWSIGNEWAFYTIFPLILYASRYKQTLWLSAVVIIFVTGWFAFKVIDAEIALEDQWSAYVHPLNQIALFAAGVMLGPTIIRNRFHTSLPVYAILAAAVFVVASYFSDIPHWVTGFGRFAMISICVICCHGFAVTRFQHGWTSMILTFLGSISYTMYLMHPIIFSCVSRVLGKIQSMTGNQHFPDQFLNNLSLGCSIVATLASSVIIYRFLEKPMIALGKRIVSRLARNACAESATTQ